MYKGSSNSFPVEADNNHHCTLAKLNPHITSLYSHSISHREKKKEEKEKEKRENKQHQLIWRANYAAVQLHKI